jgi:hypothetical protein
VAVGIKEDGNQIVHKLLAFDVAIRAQWRLLPQFGGRAMARSKKRYICVFLVFCSLKLYH